MRKHSSTGNVNFDTCIVFQQGCFTVLLCSLPILHIKVFSMDQMKHMLIEMAWDSYSFLYLKSLEVICHYLNCFSIFSSAWITADSVEIFQKQGRPLCFEGQYSWPQRHVDVWERVQSSPWFRFPAFTHECQHSLDHGKSKRVSEKYLFLLYWLCQSLWLWITINCGKFWKRWEYQTTWPASWETYMQVRKQHLELDMEQQTGSK